MSTISPVPGGGPFDDDDVFFTPPHSPVLGRSPIATLEKVDSGAASTTSEDDEYNPGFYVKGPWGDVVEEPNAKKEIQKSLTAVLHPENLKVEARAITLLGAIIGGVVGAGVLLVLEHFGVNINFLGKMGSFNFDTLAKVGYVALLAGLGGAIPAYKYNYLLKNQEKLIEDAQKPTDYNNGDSFALGEGPIYEGL